MIIAHLTCDARSLSACTLTCYSWYLAAASHLHNTLVTRTNHWNRKLWWQDPLWRMHALGLLPLVKILWIRGDHQSTFSPTQLNPHTLRQFSALINVRNLLIDNLDIPSFMPNIQQYFGHFLPTVQVLALFKPRGSCRQIIYFIGLFRHLEDLEFHDGVNLPPEPVDDSTLIPPHVPPLRGSLVVVCFGRADLCLLRAMIKLFGGVRFRFVTLSDTRGTRLILDACVETLEVLRLYPYNPRGGQPSQRDV